MSQPSPPPRVNPCGTGTLSISLAGAPSGEEQYEVLCRESGVILARGTSKISLGGLTADYVVTMELDSAAVPHLVTAKGTSSTGPLDDSLVLRGAQSTFTRGGQTQPVAARDSVSYVGNNLFWPLALVLARYDPEGGAQQIPIFPTLTATLAYQQPDTVLPASAAAGPPRTFHRYALTLGPTPIVIWSDDAGRMAMIAVSAVRLLVTDVRDAAYAPALADAAGLSRAARAPDYSAPANAPFTAEEVTVEANGYTLAGTLLIPKGGSAPYPAALTITGSGQQTRDSALPIPGLEEYAPFRQIAESLAARGIAVLRVDDRGIGGSTGAATLSDATSSSFAEDVRAQLRFLRRRPDIDGARIALIGHSEGALIAPMVAATDSTVAALVLMAGTSTPGDSVLREQLEDMLARDSTLTDSQKTEARERQRETLRRIAEGENVPGVSGAAWLREFMASDPLEVIGRVDQPVLIIQGGHDRQVLEHHAHSIAAALEAAGNQRAELRVFPRLNHLLLPSETGAFSEYGSLSEQAVGEDLLDTIADWLVKVLAVR
jgi:alpha-beta hydrolase superfamily lysophospholipase